MLIALVAECPNGCGWLNSYKRVSGGRLGGGVGRHLRCRECGATVYTEEAEFVDGDANVSGE
jgi:hypothetical protein